jgi:hypothetical protein
MFNNLTTPDNLSSTKGLPNCAVNQRHIVSSEAAFAGPLGHVLVAGTRRGLGNGNGVGSRKRILQAAFEAPVESLPVLFLAPSPLACAVRRIRSGNLIFGLQRPVPVPLVHDRLALIYILADEAGLILYARTSLLFHRLGTPPPFMISGTCDCVTAGDQP